MTLAEKREMMKKLDNVKLLEQYMAYSKIYDPLDENICDIHHIIRQEILRRMQHDSD